MVNNKDIQNNDLSHAPGRGARIELHEESL